MIYQLSGKSTIHNFELNTNKDIKYQFSENSWKKFELLSFNVKKDDSIEVHIDDAVSYDSVFTSINILH